eukprot:Em0001g1819a
MYAKCLTECIAASGTVSCLCCSDDDPSHARPASNGIFLCCYQMLEDIDCAGCNRRIRTGDDEGHECVPSLTSEVEKQAAELLKRTISTSPDKGVVQLATGGAVKEVLTLSDEERQCLLATASISSSIEIGPAQV